LAFELHRLVLNVRGGFAKKVSYLEFPVTTFSIIQFFVVGLAKTASKWISEEFQHCFEAFCQKAICFAEFRTQNCKQNFKPLNAEHEEVQTKRVAKAKVLY
jgi:hypothetical protein